MVIVGNMDWNKLCANRYVWAYVSNICYMYRESSRRSKRCFNTVVFYKIKFSQMKKNIICKSIAQLLQGFWRKLLDEKLDK